MELSRSRGDLTKALAMIKFLLGMDQTADIALEPLEVPPPEAGIEQTYALDTQLDEWMRVAEQGHPAIAAARAQLAASRETVAATRLEGYPSLTLTGNVYKNGYPNQGLSPASTRVSTVGIALSIPLFDGFSHQYRVRQAEALAGQRAADAILTERQTFMAVINAYSDALSTLANLRSTSRLEQAASESDKATRRKYDNGAAGIVDILNSQKLLAESRVERLQAISAWEIAQIQLINSTGSLSLLNVQPKITGP